MLGKNGLYWGTVEAVGPQDEPPLAADHISVRFGDIVHTLPPALWEGCQQGRPIEAPSSPIPGGSSSSSSSSSSRAAAAEQSRAAAAGSQQQCRSSRFTAAVSQQQQSRAAAAAGSQQRCQTLMLAGMSLEQYNAMMDQAPTMQADLDRVERDIVSELIV